jgi:NADPH-dependent 2,4-dienoyl-CoA reductase/sulfur reductase-like enzyme/rhodanese-related sulfurtransferase
MPGARPIVPDFPGVDKHNVFTVRNIPDTDFIRQYIEVRRLKKRGGRGGFIGLEMAEMLHHRKIDVTIVEAGPQVMNALDPEMAAIVHNYIRSLGINLILNDRPQSLEGEDDAARVALASGKKVDTDMVILGIGVRPEVWLAEQAGLKLGSTGGIMVDEYMCTSDPYIYAAGDAVQIRDYQSGQDALVPLAGPANRQGWIIANNIAGRGLKYPGSQGTGIVKFNNLTIAMTGKNEKHLQRMGWDYMVCHIHPNSHASYYPGATQMTLKLLFAPQDGKVLGAQIVGHDGVDKRIDVLATAIHAGLNVFDLQELELAYAPPFSSAKDPVNMAAYVAGNMVRGDVEVIYWQDVEELVKNGAYLLDVRTKVEVEKGMVPGAHHITLDELRENLDKLPRDREIIAYCQLSLRSYIANRILLQHGFKVKNISGGYKLYSAINNL